MFQNYFKTAIRSIIRERYYATIKIAGLALGLGTTMVIFLYVAHELSFDTSHPDIDRTYDVLQSNIWNSKGGVMNSTGPAVAFGLVSEFPEIEEVLRINTPGGQVIRYTPPNGDIVAINEESVLAADSNFFSFFDFKLKEGDPKTALTGIGKVVISDEAAKRLFGDEPALGKIIMVGDSLIAAEVTGVTVKQPTNFHFQFDYLLSMYTNPFIKEFDWSWIWTQVVTYVKLRPGANLDEINNKLLTFADRHAPPTFQKFNMDYEAFKKEKGGWQLSLQPVKDIHLQSYRTGNRLGSEGNINQVYVFGAVGVFILLIAVINFINLSTARAAKRAKEVGVKKTLGVLRKSLIIQFQIEHIVMTLAATLLALGVMEILRLVIQPIVGIEIPFSVLNTTSLMILLFVTPVVVGFLAGLYPAFYLTSFQPVQVLKGKVVSGLRSSLFRNGLVIFQFTISIILMVVTLVVFEQLKLFQSKDIGFNKENLLVINYADKLGDNLESFQNEIIQYPGVKSATVSMDVRQGFEDLFMREGDETKYSLSRYKIDAHFFETTKISILTGRSFDERRPSDIDAVIITETTCKLLGWTPQEALGKKMLYLGDDVGPQEIIGVAKDVHLQSLRQNIEPIMFFNIKSNIYGPDRIMLIRYDTKDIDELVSKIEKRWSEVSGAIPLSHAFYDQQIRMQYQQEKRLGSMFFIFTGLSIAIAILGLIGLVSYSAEQRKKEIGVRKVFGASLTGIYVMMNKEYVRLMFIALLIAAPTSYWMIQQWLITIPDTNRVSINPLIFIVAFVAELLLALLCVGYLAVRAASLNPSDVLKEE